MEERSWKQGRVEARFEGGQGPEGAVAPYMEWNGMEVHVSRISLFVLSESKVLSLMWLKTIDRMFP